MIREAYIDETKQYRYTLRREWDDTKDGVIWIMLNPSTADAHTDDPTIRRCISFSQQLGFGKMLVLNAYALRSSNPSALLTHNNPVGPHNRYQLEFYLTSNKTVIGAWGNHKLDPQIEKLLKTRTNMMCLGKNKNGSPKHPLYIKNNTLLIPLWTN